MNKKEKKEFAKKAMEAKDTPLDHWSKDVDPAIMAGDEWVDKKNDFGHATTENKELHKGINAQSGTFMHPVHDVSYGKD
ncbi:DUF3905 domain-containing protein [Tepidibacillus fermentans]|uniref:Uncharacterized protein DUF3905 n=1 Tax=Tepidibacillus fermentans TaxID=1281767 RepID=A0A4V6NZ05_9BACI|nr:DUF3905 domain-containing protein [Tepidibacillus fermentans]TCS83694.1 uncharacterized protein DUF3905 [Tepidibacillus fermentans]